MEPDIYGPCDRAIQQCNRENLAAFGKLKLARFDRLNIIQAIESVYTESARKARRRYYEVGIEAYILGLIWCGVGHKEAHEMAEKAITMEWVDDVLRQVDFVTLYRFTTETERKIQRLTERISALADRQRREEGIHQEDRKRRETDRATGIQAEIDKALRDWTRQVGQYFINITDYAVLQAYEDAGDAEGVEEVKEVEWITERDERVCDECRDRDGVIYPLQDVPSKPHMNCRCRLRPVRK